MRCGHTLFWRSLSSEENSSESFHWSYTLLYKKLIKDQGPELHCLLKVLNFQDAKKKRFKLIQINIVSVFSVDHKYDIDPSIFFYLAFNIAC